MHNFRDNSLPGETRESDSLGAWIPGTGITYTPLEQLTLFTGIHKGFAPPRTEDVIGGTGTSTDMGSEKSVNFEFRVRTRPARGVDVQAAYFRNYFDRLIAVGSIAGGNAPLAQGKASFEGVEVPEPSPCRGAFTTNRRLRGCRQPSKKQLSGRSSGARSFPAAKKQIASPMRPTAPDERPRLSLGRFRRGV